MQPKTAASCLAALSVLFLTACGGGGGSAVAPAQAPAAAPASKSVKSVNVAFSIKIPSADKIAVLKRRAAKTVASRRIPQYVSPATYSFAIAVNGTAAPNAVIPCSGGTCQGTVNAPVGTDTFSISFFDQTGKLLDAGTSAPENITAKGPNAVKINCDGVPSTGEIYYIAAKSLAIGTPVTIPFSFIVWDADAYQIIGNLDNISVVMSDSVLADASHFALNVASSLTDANSAGTLVYDGGVVMPQSTVLISLLYSPPGSAVVALDNEGVAIGPIATPTPPPSVPTPVPAPPAS